MVLGKGEITRQIADLKERLAALDRERSQIVANLSALERAQPTAADQSRLLPHVTMASPSAEKIALFRSLFRGRVDVFPRRWENSKTGKSGYAPASRCEARR